MAFLGDKDGFRLKRHSSNKYTIKKIHIIEKRLLGKEDTKYLDLGIFTGKLIR